MFSIPVFEYTENCEEFKQKRCIIEKNNNNNIETKASRRRLIFMHRTPVFLSLQVCSVCPRGCYLSGTSSSERGRAARGPPSASRSCAPWNSVCWPPGWAASPSSVSFIRQQKLLLKKREEAIIYISFIICG